MKKRKAVLVALLVLSMTSALMGCQNTSNTETSQQEENTNQASGETEVGGW